MQGVPPQKKSTMMKNETFLQLRNMHSPCYRHILSPFPGTTICPVQTSHSFFTSSPLGLRHTASPLQPHTVFSSQAWLPRQRPSLIGKLTRPTGQKPKSYLRQRLRHQLFFISSTAFPSSPLHPSFYSFSPSPHLLPSSSSNNTRSVLPTSFRSNLKATSASFATLRLPCCSTFFVSSAPKKKKKRRAFRFAPHRIVQKSPSPTGS